MMTAKMSKQEIKEMFGDEDYELKRKKLASIYLED